MNTLLRYCLLMMISSFSFAKDATGLPGNLIKITKENNPKCVEFVLFKGELYCSTQAINTTPIDPQVVNYETQNIHFDNRPWKMAWGDKTDYISTVEYIPITDNINNWKELITSQFIPNKEVTLKQYVDFTKENLGKTVTDFQFDIIEEKPDYTICEFRVKSPDNLIQDELFKVTKAKDGLHILHYAIKKADMGDAERKKWIEQLKLSTLK